MFPAHFRTKQEILGIFLSVFALVYPFSASALSEGDKIPRVTLTTATGKKIDVNGYAKEQKKRNLLFLFFRTGTCAICIHQLQEIAQRYDEIGDLNATALAISLDDAIIQSQTSQKIENKFPILLDPDGKTVKAFGVFNPDEKLSRPSIFVVGPDGKILYTYVGKGISDRPPTQQVMAVLKHYSGLLPTTATRGVSTPQSK